MSSKKQRLPPGCVVPAEQVQRSPDTGKKRVSEMQHRYKAKGGSGSSKGLLVHEDVPILIFSAYTYFCGEDEPCMVMEVLRIGDVSGTSQVRYSTVDMTGKAGQLYEHTEGILKFTPGMTAAELSVPIIRNSYWDTTQDFGVELSTVDLENAILGPYLCLTKVKVINGSCFPTNRYAIDIIGNCLKFVNKWALFVEYLKMHLRHSSAFKSSCLRLVNAMLQSFVIFSKLLVFLIMFHVAFDPAYREEDVPFQSRFSFFMLIISVSIVLSPVIYLLDVKQAQKGFDAALIAMLQKNLLRKFMNYTVKSRDECSRFDFRMCMNQDVKMLVESGSMRIFPIAAAIFDLVALFAFEVTSFVILDEGFPYWGLIPLLAYPLLAAAVFYFSIRTCDRAVSQLKQDTEECRSQVMDAEQHVRLIVDYNQHNFFLERHERRLQMHQQLVAWLELNRKNSYGALAFTTVLVVSAHVFVEGRRLASEPSEATPTALGEFVLTIYVLVKNDEIWTTIMANVFGIHSSLGCLLRITKLLNLQIDVPARLRMNRQRREMSMKLRKQMGLSTSAVDTLPILAENLNFALEDLDNVPPSATRSGGPSSTLNYGGKMEFGQGQFVALIGPQGQGKSTLLRLMSDMLIQEHNSGNVTFVPSHLRVLDVNSEPMFVHGTLFANLTFGTAQQGDRMGPRVATICKAVGLGPEVLCHLTTKRILPWGNVLSQSQKHLLSLARALISNPELLCVHKPTSAFDEVASMKALRALKEFVRQKGLCLPSTVKRLCRPRTCLITTSKLEDLANADVVFHVSSARGVRKVEKDEATGSYIFEKDDLPRNLGQGLEDLIQQLEVQDVPSMHDAGEGDEWVERS